MTSEQVVRTIVMLLAISTVSAASISGKRQEKLKLVITGRVVAYDQLISLTNITNAPRSEFLLVRVETRLKGREDSRLIQVKYVYMGDDLKLPIEVFDSKNKWQFALHRDSTCDGSLRSLQENKPKAESEMSLPRFKPTNGAETEEIPLDANLPCYVLQHGDLKPSR